MTWERFNILFSLLLAVAMLVALLVWGSIGFPPAVLVAVVGGALSYFESRRQTRWWRREWRRPQADERASLPD